MTKPKLKPCPFCGDSGGQGVVVEKHWDAERQCFFYCVRHNWCGSVGGGVKTKLDAIAAWNRRKP